jgi:cohesin complex subunit SA-1/2
MRPVMMLLLDANGKIRAAAAAVVPALLAGDADAAAEAAALDEYDENIATTTTAAKKKAVRGKASSVSEKDAKTRETLMSLVGIIESLGGSRARAAGAVDALWDEFGDVLSEWGVVFEMFLSDEASARVPGKARGRAGKADPVSESRCGAHLESDEAAGLANLLACASRRALGERLVRPDGAPRPPTKAQRESHERAREAFTQNAMRWLPAALRKWRSDEAVVAPLLETARHLRLEHYSLKRKEHEFDELAKVAGEIFRAHSGRRTMEACAGALHHAVAEGSESLRELAKRRVEASYAESAEKLRAALAETYASKESRKKKNGSSRDTSEDSREDQAQFRVRVELARLNALLSLMPPPSGPNVPIAARDSFEDLVSIVAAAAEGRASVQPRAAALATRGAALALSHALFDLVDRGASNVTADEVKEHVAMRDAFVSSAVALARTSVDALDAAAAAAAAASRGSDSKTPPGPSLLGLRSVPKAAVAAFAHLVVCYQRPRAAAADAAQAEAAKSRRVHGDADGGGGGDDVYPAYASPAPVFAPLEFIPDEDAFRAVWDACNQLLDPPAGAEEDAAPGRRDSEDGDDFGDEESARLAYALACAEAAVGDHRFVAAELLANREQSGRWTDLAISALLGDLRHLGPKAVGDVIFYSLVSAYDEVVSGDTEDPDAVVAMEHAFEEFSARLAHMFNVGSARDRVVCRHVVEEGLKHCIPTASFDQEKLPFLSLGLAAFVPKIAAADAKTFASPLQTVVDAVDAEDRANAPLVDFAERVAARARGAAAPHPARNLAEPAFAHDEDPVDAEPTQDEEPVRAFGAGERRRR